MTRYGETALDRECSELARLTDGRHQRLCHASFVIGQLIGLQLDRSEAERALFAAAYANGYVRKRGATAARATIRSGLDRGATTPRVVKHAARRGQSTTPRPQTTPPPSKSDVDEISGQARESAMAVGPTSTDRRLDRRDLSAPSERLWRRDPGDARLPSRSWRACAGADRRFRTVFRAGAGRVGDRRYRRDSGAAD